MTPAAAETDIFKQMTEAHIAFCEIKIPMNRFVQVEEIAAMVAWLASEDCSFTTGGVFDISGGRATYWWRSATGRKTNDEGRMLRGKWRKTNPAISSLVIRHSGDSRVAFEALTTFAHLSISVLMWAANCSGVLPTPSAPDSPGAPSSPGVCSIFWICAETLSTISFGVPAGASKPNQELASNPASRSRRWSARSAKLARACRWSRRWLSACRP